MIDQKINLITDHFLNNINEDDRHKSISLFSGRSGTIIYLLELFKATGDNLYKDHLLNNLDYIFDELNRSERLICTYCDGIAGWGWLIEFLKSEGIISNEYDSVLDDLDLLLEEQIAILTAQKNFDLLHGLLGLGVYFLKRKNLKNCEKILLLLEAFAVEDEFEVKFIRHDTLKMKDEIYDLGLPHGNIGSLYFISKCYSIGICTELCLRLLRKGIDFYLNNLQDPTLAGCFFPNKFPVKTYQKGLNDVARSRMAWCYGDLTILYSLFSISRQLNLTEFSAKILDMLILLCGKKIFILTQISDACFCHGSSGIAYIFLKLYNITGVEIFNDAANYWLDQTLQYGNEVGFAGYLFGVSDLNKQIKAPSSGILEGIGGIGLVLLEFKHKNKHNNWDECLFLS
jgi:lantibiotic modifying enzyme